MRRALTKTILFLVIAVAATVAALVAPSALRDDQTTELSVAAPPTSVAEAAPVFEPTATATAVPTTAPVGVPAQAPVQAPTLELPATTPTPTPTPAKAAEQADPSDASDATDADATGGGADASDGAPSVQQAELVEAPTATAVPATPTVAPTSTATPEPTSTPAPDPTATPLPEPTATPTPLPQPTATPIPQPTATPLPQPTSTPLPTATPEPAVVGYVVDAGWRFVDSDTGLLVRDDPEGNVVRALVHREQVFATGQVIESGGREWMQIESPARGWVARDFLTLTQPEAPVVIVPESSGEPPTAADWAAVRQCESGGNYAIVSSNGLYHGAYQFLPSTWDTIAARSGRPDLVDVLPSQAAPADQDAMAQALYALQGASPWPHCGQALL